MPRYMERGRAQAGWDSNASRMVVRVGRIVEM